MSDLISIIIPFKKPCQLFLTESLPALQNLNYPNYEIILLPDQSIKTPIKGVRVIPTWPKLGPADKRDIGVKNAKGTILAFIDDDAYPSPDWLKNAMPYFSNRLVAAVCGPGVTPPSDNLLSKVSGWVWASVLGSGGAGTYRSWPSKKRIVDDFPTFNLIVRKTDYLKVGGFDSAYWPGEDTKLCHDLVHQLGKIIQYDPKILVYHHRRDIFIPHLKQLGRYGKHRGHFVKALPRTSKRIGYFIPPLFALAVFISPPLLLLLNWLVPNLFTKIITTIFISAISVYLILAFLTGLWVYSKSRSVLQSLLVIPALLASHLYYGFMFIVGLTSNFFVSKYSRDQV